MYYAEKMINGILHYKTTPYGDWKPKSIESLSNRVVKAEKKVQELKRKLQEWENISAEDIGRNDCRDVATCA